MVIFHSYVKLPEGNPWFVCLFFSALPLFRKEFWYANGLEPSFVDGDHEIMAGNIFEL